jgi:predicted O-methyltransferase YrrM
MCKDKKKIIEIGVNACHSLLIMLLENPTAEYVLFDLNIHPYTVPTLEYLKNSFPTTKISAFFGNSVQTVTQYITDDVKHTFDLCHLDGGHRRDVFSVDYENMKQLMVKDGVVIFDDYDYPEIFAFLQEKLYEITEVDSIQTPLHFIYRYD